MGVRRRWWVSGVVAVAVAAITVAVASAAGGPDTTASNRTLARTLAGQLLSKVALPPGATQVRTSAEDPGTGTWLDGPASVPAAPLSARRHLFYRVPGDPQSVIAWIQAHRPPGLKFAGRGGGGRYGVTQYWDVEFAAPPVAGRISQAGVGVGATAARGGGTALRVDDFAVWLIPRPASEVIPAGVRSVLVSVDHYGGGAFKQTLVTVPRTVARLVSFVDSRPLGQPGAHSCPALGAFTRVLDLRFLGPGGAGAVALARTVEDGCGDLSFSIRGHRQHWLEEDGSLGALLRRLRVQPATIS